MLQFPLHTQSFFNLTQISSILNKTYQYFSILFQSYSNLVPVLLKSYAILLNSCPILLKFFSILFDSCSILLKFSSIFQSFIFHSILLQSSSIPAQSNSISAQSCSIPAQSYSIPA